MAALSPNFDPQFFDGGAPAAGYLLHTYATGTTTPLTTYQDQGATIPNTNPIVLDAAGRAKLWLSPSTEYRLELKTPLGATVSGYPIDDVGGVSTAIDDAAIRDDLASTASGKGSALVGFKLTATGAAIRTLQAKLSEAVSVLDFGADPTGATDSTTQIAAALAASLAVYFPAGTYMASAIFVNRVGASIVTDGFATVFQQKSGTSIGTRLISVQANDVTIGSCVVRGNIATDTNEQNHGVIVQATATTGNLTNITVGDIKGYNIRGDVLYIGAANTYKTKDVTFGRISGNNILRHVVTIAGASNVFGTAALADGPVGMWAIDIEPDAVTCHDIYIGHVRGASMGCNQPLAANAAYNIHIGLADLDPTLWPDSTPGYTSHATLVRSALNMRNILSFKIDYLRARNHANHALEYTWNAGEQRGEGIEIGYLDVANVGASDTTYNTIIQGNAINGITIRDGRVVHQAVGDSVISGDSSGSSFTRAVIDRMVVDGRVARFVQQGRFSNILINSAAATSAFGNCDDCTILDSDITLPTLINFSNRNTFINVKATCSTAYYSTVTDSTRINCNFGGNIVGFATQRATSTAETGEVSIGSTTSTTIGAAGGAAAQPATPRGYLSVYIPGVGLQKIAYHNP